MVNQGDIIKINFNPQVGHEQAGYRPALVVSNNIFNANAKLAILCPITTSDNKFPLHIPLDDRTQTKGFILCEHVKTVDLKARKYTFVEKIPMDILRQVYDTIMAEIEIFDD